MPMMTLQSKLKSGSSPLPSTMDPATCEDAAIVVDSAARWGLQAPRWLDEAPAAPDESISVVSYEVVGYGAEYVRESSASLQSLRQNL